MNAVTKEFLRYFGFLKVPIFWLQGNHKSKALIKVETRLSKLIHACHVSWAKLDWGSSSPASESMHHHHHHQGYSTLFGKHGTPLAAVHGLQGGAGAPFFSLLSQKSPHSSVKCESFAFFK